MAVNFAYQILGSFHDSRVNLLFVTWHLHVQLLLLSIEFGTQHFCTASFFTMSPKRQPDSSPAGSGAKKAKVNHKRLDKILSSLESETQAARADEQLKFVCDEMRLSQSLCDQCYGFALKAKKLRECEDEFHRNTNTQSQVAYKHKEANISRLKVFRKEVWSAISVDKKLVEQIWYWLTGQGPTTLIGVVSMPIENWHELADNNTERHGVVSAWREVLWNAESFDNNFEFGPYCFVKPRVQDMLMQK